MDELSCPRCRMTKYRNPSLRLMINSCGHALCEACVDLIYTRESAPCPDCGRTLRKSGFRTQLFEDTRVDKEVDIRKSILKIYNKQESDFSILREYNDYLEEIEEIIWNLESGRNERETRERISLYKQENEALIRKNQARLNQERNYLKETLAREAKDQQIKAQMLNQMDKEMEAAKKRGQEELLNDLTNSTGLSTAEVIARHKKLKADDQKSRMKMEERMSLGGFNNAPDIENTISQPHTSYVPDPLFVYSVTDMDIAGPDMPGKETMFEYGYLRNIRDVTLKDIGGGYDSIMACERALYDAFGGLFVNPSSVALEVT